MTTFLIHRTDRPIGHLSPQSPRSPDRPSISSIGSDDRLSISSIYRSPDRPSISSIGIDDRLSISSIYRSPDRPSISSIGIDDRLSISSIYRSPDRPSISSIGSDDRLSISSIGGRVFLILAYFSQSCLTRCDGRPDGSSVCQWTPTDRHSKRSYSIRPDCILKGVRIEEGYCTISQPIKATKQRGVLISLRLSFVEMSPT